MTAILEPTKNGTLVDTFGDIGALVDAIPTAKKSGGGGRRKCKDNIGAVESTVAPNKEHNQNVADDDGVGSPPPMHPPSIVAAPTNNNSITNIQQDRQRGEVDPRNFDHLLRLAELIREMANLGEKKPRIGIITGSGLGPIADQMDEARILPFAEVPGFPKPSVVGHKGNLVFGRLAGKLCVCLQGRFHPYEHHMDMGLCTMPIRLMALLGVRTLIVSNAAGGLNPEFKMGDLMIIKDHIFLPGLTGHSPLLGINDARFGSRFVSMHNAYDTELRKKAKELGHALKVPLREGIYVMNGGPQYETAAECAMIARMGGDAVGMSTCHEVTVARQCGMRVFGFSLITNCSSLDADQPVAITHDEVLEAAASAGEVASRWVTELVAQLGPHLTDLIDE